MRLNNNVDNGKMMIITCGFEGSKKSRDRAFNTMFYYNTKYKNKCVKIIKEMYDNLLEENPELKKIQDRITELEEKDGKVSKEKEKVEELRELYYKRRRIILSNEQFSTKQLKKKFYTDISYTYSIYMDSDEKNYAVQNVLASFEKFLKGEGKDLREHRYNEEMAIVNQNKYKENGNRNNVKTSIEFIDGKPYLSTYDIGKNYIKKCERNIAQGKKIPNHKKKLYALHISEKDAYNMKIYSATSFGQTKICRMWKNGKWKYYVQISIKETSPIVKKMPTSKCAIGVDIGTETAAYCSRDGHMGIEMLAKDSPRTTEKVNSYKKAASRSILANNKEAVDENGVFLSRKERKKRNIELNKSKRYIKLQRRVRDISAHNKRRRKTDNLKVSKNILIHGNEVFTEDNNIKAWGMKRGKMNRIARKKYDNGVRANDYTPQIQDHAPGQVQARIKSVCESKGMPYHQIKGLDISTLNHFTGKNDLFTSLKDRIVLVNPDKRLIGDDFSTADFIETFANVEYNGKKYLLQRDLYASAKMLFCYEVSEQKEVKDKKTGEKKVIEVTKWVFDREGFSKFFDEIFYPIQEKYIIDLYRRVQNGEQFSGTILGF